MLIQVAQTGIQTFCGLSLEWGAILIPTFASIIVFLIGIIIDKLNEFCRKKRETKEFRDTLFKWIELTQKAVKGQIDILNGFSDAIEANTTLQNERLTLSRNMVDKLDIVNAKNLIKYLIFNSSKPQNDRRAECVFNMISQIDFLGSLEPEIRKQYDSYQKESIALFDDWNSNIMSIQRLCAGKYSAEESDKMVEFISIVQKWAEQTSGDSEVNVSQTMQLLMTPILNATKNHSFKQPGFEEVDLIKENALQLKTVYDRWLSLSSGFSKVFREYARNANTALTVLMSSKNYFLDSTKVVR